MLSLRTTREGENGANCGKIADSAAHLRPMARKIVLIVGRLAQLPEWALCTRRVSAICERESRIAGFQDLWNSLHDDKNDYISDAKAQDCPRPFAFDPRSRLRAKHSSEYGTRESGKDTAGAAWCRTGAGRSRSDLAGKG